MRVKYNMMGIGVFCASIVLFGTLNSLNILYVNKASNLIVSSLILTAYYAYVYGKFFNKKLK